MEGNDLEKENLEDSKIEKVCYPNARGSRIILRCCNCGIIYSKPKFKVKNLNLNFCCIECYKQYRKDHKKDPKEQNKLYQKKHKYGLSKDDYLKLFSEQDNKCSICGCEFTDKTKAFVDHDHLSGKVRGLLCTRCNTLLGMARDNIDILKNAIDYLKKNKK